MEEQAAHLATNSFWKILNGLQGERCAHRGPEERKLHEGHGMHGKNGDTEHSTSCHTAGRPSP